MSDIRRTYFQLPATFDPDNPTKWGTVLVFLKIAGLETLTPEYYAAIDPDGDPNVDYAHCDEVGGVPVCDLDTPINTYNPFLGIPDLVWASIDGYFRGQIQGTTGPNYGTAITDLGTAIVNSYYAEDYPELTDIRQAVGSIFIDIDYDFDFRCVFWVYENQVPKFSYTIDYVAATAVTKYYRESFTAIGRVDVSKWGWQSGIESNPYITPPLPTPPDCVYDIRTLGFSVPVKMPSDESQVISDCCKSLFVFGSTLDQSRDFNDFTSLYYYRSLVVDTVTFNLKNVDTGTQVTILDNTYGSYFAFNSLAQKDLSAVIIEWRLVLLNFVVPGQTNGVGNYQINKVIQTAGQTVNIEGIVFKLKEFTAQAADRTMRITTIQNGDIAHLGVSFKGVQFPSSLRVPGFFGMRDPKFIQDNVVYRDYQSRQISMRQNNEYQFKTEQVKDCVFREIMDFMLLANEIYVSDYNLENHSVYKNVAVELQENEGTEYLFKRSMIMNLVFNDRVKNRFKSNYGLTQIAGSAFLEGQIGEPPIPPPPVDDVIIIKGYFTIAGEPDMPPILIDNDTAGHYVTLLFDAGSGTVQLEKNNITVVVPFDLAPGDILDAHRTTDDLIGWYKIQT